MWIILILAFLLSIVLMWGLVVTGKAWLVRHSEQMAEEVGANLADVFIFVDRQRTVAVSVLAVLGAPVAVYLLTRHVLPALIAIPLSLVIPRMYVRRVHRVRMKQLEEQLPDFLLMVTGAIRAGSSLNAAIESAVKESHPPVSQEFDLLMREIRLGVELVDALHHMERRIPTADFAMISAAIVISREVGGNLAEILEGLSRTLRQKRMMEGKIKALTSQGRMQGIVMAALPIFLMLVLTRMEPRAMHPLFFKPIGWITLGVIAVMEALGYFFIKKITRINV